MAKSMMSFKKAFLSTLLAGAMLITTMFTVTAPDVGLVPPSEDSDNFDVYEIAAMSNATTDLPLENIRDDEMEAVRREFYEKAQSNQDVPLEPIYVDFSDIIHKPQVWAESDDVVFASESEYSTAVTDFTIGTTRPFQLQFVLAKMNGTLMAQSEHANVWLIDHDAWHAGAKIRACGSHCTLESFTVNMAKEVGSEFDKIYKNMTDPVTGFAPHKSVVLNTGSGYPIGDVGNDGRVNILLYDIDDNGGVGSGYVGGFFTHGDFDPIWNALDMFHMDIGRGHGFRAFEPTATLADKLLFYGVLAHEFQHLLFYMHYGVYPTSATVSESLWMNETFSEMALAFYVRPGFEIVDYSRLLSASNPTYNATTSDFVSFNNSAKSYGMSRMFAHWLYKTMGDNFAADFYSYLMSELPRANSASMALANRNNITSNGGMRGMFGNAFKSATGIGNGGNDSFAKLYFLFMEAFAADGGYFGNEVNKLTKMYDVKNPPDNLWAVRPIIGVPGGRVFATLAEARAGAGGSYAANGSNYTVLESGSNISVTGTKERLFKLSEQTENNHILNITVPNSVNSNGYALYYVALVQDDLLVGGTVHNPLLRSTGDNGANVYPLRRGESTRVDTKGKQAYLVVATFSVFNGSASTVIANGTVTYNWETSLPCADCEQLNCIPCDKSDCPAFTECDFYCDHSPCNICGKYVCTPCVNLECLKPCNFDCFITIRTQHSVHSTGTLSLSNQSPRLNNADIQPLSRMTKLDGLILSTNSISNISPLSGLTNLQSLNAWSNQISSISPVSGLVNLVDIQMSSNQIRDLTPLYGLTKLKTLDIRNNPVCPHQISALKANLPELAVTENSTTNNCVACEHCKAACSFGSACNHDFDPPHTGLDDVTGFTVTAIVLFAGSIGLIVTVVVRRNRRKV